MIYCNLSKKYAAECDDVECDHFSVCDTTDDEPGYCGHCSGSGEGGHDGSKCGYCHGSGVERRDEE